MSIVVVRKGLLDSVQDLGRPGYRAFGINPGGAMDRVSLQLANALAGNEPGEAALELHFPAGAFLFTRPALIALAGADFGPLINGEPVPLHHPLLVGKNDILQFRHPGRGARLYLAVQGGFSFHPWLGSGSTHLQAGVGGWQGKALEEKDELPFRNPGLADSVLPEKTYRVLPWEARYPPPASAEIRVLPGREWYLLQEASRVAFTEQTFTVTRQSDRMGSQLNHPPLQLERKTEMISTGVLPGTLQLLPDGRLLALLADCQTTGGYPRVAQVITADLHRLGQALPGDELRFRGCTQEAAEAALEEQAQLLRQIRSACSLRLQEEKWLKRS